jgi:hypothetical protein
MRSATEHETGCSTLFLQKDAIELTGYHQKTPVFQHFDHLF